MGIETLNAMNEGMYRSQMMIIEVIMIMNLLLISAGLIVYLAGTIWYCFGETRQPARRQITIAQELPEPEERDLLALLAGLDEEPDGFTGMPRCERELQRVSSA